MVVFIDSLLQLGEIWKRMTESWAEILPPAPRDDADENRVAMFQHCGFAITLKKSPYKLIKNSNQMSMPPLEMPGGKKSTLFRSKEVFDGMSITNGSRFYLHPPYGEVSTTWGDWFLVWSQRGNTGKRI